MNRREFIKGLSALALAGLLPGCRKVGLKENAGTAGSAAGTLSFRTNAALGVKVSLLGYGIMRMPMNEDGTINREKSLALIDRAMKAGINYYDTAWFYQGGDSENLVGEALSRYPRDSYYLASKLPVGMIDSVEQAEEVFSQQLKKCRVDYFDFYLLHSINSSLWKKSLEKGFYDFCLSLKKRGLVRRLGFSFHDDSATLKEIIGYGKWDFVQIQANCLDWKSFAGNLYEEAVNSGLPVVVMEPLRGGNLAKIKGDAKELLDRARPASTSAEWAFRFIAGKPGVLTVLSGMTEMAHLEENIATFSPLAPLSPVEEETLAKAVEIYRNVARPACTGCQYCQPCPAGVAIPKIFEIYGRYCDGLGRGRSVNAYAALDEREKATSCVNCGACLKKCPQKIDIPNEIMRIRRELDG